MATIKRFEDIEAWKRARALCDELGKLIHEGDLAKDYKLREQINGSSGSIMDNIAEGFERVAAKSLFSFCLLQKDRVAKPGLSSTAYLTGDIFQKKNSMDFIVKF